MDSVRRFRGIFGLAATWGAALGAVATSTLVIGLATGVVPSDIFGAREIIAVAVRGLAVGSVAGGLFGWLLTVRERHETFDTLSTKRTAIWGAIAAASVPLLVLVATTGPALPLGVLAASVGGFGIGGGLFASTLLRLARRPTPVLAAASDDPNRRLR